MKASRSANTAPPQVQTIFSLTAGLMFHSESFISTPLDFSKIKPWTMSRRLHDRDPLRVPNFAGGSMISSWRSTAHGPASYITSNRFLCAPDKRYLIFTALTLQPLNLLAIAIDLILVAIDLLLLLV